MKTKMQISCAVRTADQHPCFCYIDIYNHHRILAIKAVNVDRISVILLTNVRQQFVSLRVRTYTIVYIHVFDHDHHKIIAIKAANIGRISVI